MTAEEKTLLLAVAALAVGRGDKPLPAEDKAFLATLIGGNDWDTVRGNLMPLIRAVAGARG